LAFERRSADREWLTFVCRLVNFPFSPRRISSLEHGAEVIDNAPPADAESRRTIGQRQIGQRQRDEDRDVIIAQAQEKNAQAFAPLDKPGRTGG
jgi:hypothetical protein